MSRNEIIAVVLLSLASPVQAERIIPHRDLTYLGAFVVPDRSQYIGGPGGGTFNPSGDPRNVDSDEFYGSLYIFANKNERTLAEISIPKPEVRKDRRWDLLPVATELQRPTEITDGYTYLVNGDDPSKPPRTVRGVDYRPSDVEVLSDGSLIWVLTKYYTQTPNNYADTIGYVNRDFDTDLRSGGYFGLDFKTSAPYSQYLFRIPLEWAKKYTDGKQIAIGQNRFSTNGSSGPTIFAINDWGDSPPENGADLEYRAVLHYMRGPDTVNQFRYYMESNTPGDGTWVDIGNKQAVVFYGTYAERGRVGQARYGNIPQYVYSLNATPDEHGEAKGYVGYPYQFALYFYDPDALADVATGKNLSPWTVQPYAAFSIQDHVFSGLNQNRRQFGMISFDATGHILYVEERLEGAVGTDYRSVIHMFRVSSEDGTLDTTPPTAPTELRIASKSEKQIALEWSSGIDSQTEAWHVVRRNGVPISFVRPSQSHYVDDKVDAWLDLGVQMFKYEVIALDEYYNYSQWSNSVQHNFDEKNFSDIVYYHSCDHLESAEVSSRDGRVFPSPHSHVLKNHQPLWGLGQWDNAQFQNHNEVSVRIPIGNIDLHDGRLGFSFIPYANGAFARSGAFLGSNDQDNSDLGFEFDGNGHAIFHYLGAKRRVDVRNAMSVSPLDNEHFIEFRFDGPECTIFLNGQEIETITSHQETTATQLEFLGRGKTPSANRAAVDQILFSNDKSRDLFKIRRNTTFHQVEKSTED